MESDHKKYIRMHGLVILLILTVTSYSQNRKIQFIEKPWQEIINLAKEQNKLIFLDGYTSWCGPCKWMAANMFTNDSIADLYNKTFICAHLDMEKGEGLKISSDYQVKAYPTLLFIDGNGAIIHKRVGAPQKVSEYLEMALIALTPGEGFTPVQKKYNEGTRDAAFMFKYFKRMQEAYIPVNEQVDEYLASINEEKYWLPENWKIIFQFVTDMTSPAFIFLQGHQKEFSKKFSPDSVDQKIFSVYLQSLAMMARNPNFSQTEYQAIKLKIRNSGYAGAEKVIFTADLFIFQMHGEIKQFLELAAMGMDKFYSRDPDMLNQVGSVVLQVASDDQYIGLVTGWAKRCLELKKSPENYDFYAQALYKSGNLDEAIKNEQLAIDLAKKQKVASEKFESNLKRFQLK